MEADEWTNKGPQGDDKQKKVIKESREEREKERKRGEGEGERSGLLNKMGC